MTAPPHTPSRAALAVLLCGTFMASLDTAIVNVAGPAIQSDVGVSGAALQLVVSGYALAYAALLITGARLGDDHGHRRLFLAGLAGFTLMSLLAGLAWSTPVLIAARIGQGVAAAAMGPQVMTVIQLQYDGAARMKAMALLATVVSAGVVAGQVLGGLLVDLDVFGASWRPVFLINVPVGLALLAVGPRLLPVTKRPSGRRMDWLGVVLVTDIITLVMVPLVFGHQVGWAGWTWACLAAAVPSALLLALHLRRVLARGGAPVADVRLLAAPRFGLGMASTTAVMVAYGGFLFTLTLHLQQGLGDSPLRAGLTFAPYALGFVANVFGAEDLGVGGEFHHDAIGIGEIDRADEYAVVHRHAHRRLAVVVVHDHRDDLDPRLDEPADRGLQLVLFHVKGQMVHRSDRGLVVAGKFLHRRDARRRGRRILPPEKGDRRSTPAIEEEMLAAGRQFDRLDQRHLQHLGIEFDRFGHVARHQRDVIDPHCLHLVSPEAVTRNRVPLPIRSRPNCRNIPRAG